MRHRCLTVAILVATLASVAGCGVFYWGKPGTTVSVEQFERDSNECAKEALKVPAAQVSRDEFDKAYRQCLRSRGYVREQRSSHDPGWHRGIE